MKHRITTLFGGLLQLTVLSLGLLLLSAPGWTEPPAQIDDTLPPTLVSMSLDPISVDVTSAAAVVTFRLHLTDDLSGVDVRNTSGFSSYIYLRSPGPQYQYVYVSLYSFSRTDQNQGDLDTTWEGTTTIPKLAQAGTWRVEQIEIYDKAGNRLSLYGDNLNYLSLSGLEVTSPPDVTAPQVVEFGFIDPSADPTAEPMPQITIDTSNRGQQVTMRMRVIDDSSGIGPETDLAGNPVNSGDLIQVDARFLSSGIYNSYGWSSYWNRISGTPQDGIWEASVYFPQYSPDGVRTLQAYIKDNAGNRAYYDSYSLDFTTAPVSPLLMPSDIIDCPAFAARLVSGDGYLSACLFWRLSPSTQYDLSAYLADPAAADAAALDDLLVRLVEDLNVIISGEWPLWYSCRVDWSALRPQTQLLANNYGNGTSQGDILLRLNRLLLEDGYPADLARLPDGRITITVISEPSDKTPPTVQAIELSPITINTSESDQTVTFTVDARDDLSGLQWVQFYLRSPSSGQSRRGYASPWYAGSTQPDSNNPLQWQLRGSVVFPRYSEAGTWKVDYIYAGDMAGNYEPMWLADPTHPEYASLAVSINVIRPSLSGDGTIPPEGGTVTDPTFGDRAQVTIPDNAVSVETTVAIDVLASPLEVPTPTGFVGPDTYYVNIHLDPTPNYPLDPPGLTVVLPLVNPLPPGTVLDLFRINEVSGLLEPSIDVYGFPVHGTVDVTGWSVVFNGVSRLSTVVGMLAEPVIAWSAPADISYGTALSEGQLSASANIAGSFAYSPALGTVLSAGSGQLLTATFTAEDTVHYPKPYTKTVTINVARVPLVITADDQVKVAGAALPAFTASYDGFVLNETAADLTQQPVLQTTAHASSAPGKYEITVSGALSDNYDISYVAGTLSVIAAKTVDLRAGSYSLVSSKRINATLWEYTYKGVVTNQGDGDASNVAAELTTWPSQVTVVKKSISFGMVAAGKAVSSADTFTIKLDRSKPLKQGDLKWTFSYIDPYGAPKTVANVPFN